MRQAIHHLIHPLVQAIQGELPVKVSQHPCQGRGPAPKQRIQQYPTAVSGREEDSGCNYKIKYSGYFEKCQGLVNVGSEQVNGHAHKQPRYRIIAQCVQSVAGESQRNGQLHPTNQASGKPIFEQIHQKQRAGKLQGVFKELPKVIKPGLGVSQSQHEKPRTTCHHQPPPPAPQFLNKNSRQAAQQVKPAETIDESTYPGIHCRVAGKFIPAHSYYRFDDEAQPIRIPQYLTVRGVPEKVLIGTPGKNGCRGKLYQPENKYLCWLFQ